MSAAAVRTCRVCSCTETSACLLRAPPQVFQLDVRGCTWLEADLCSACVPGADVVRGPLKNGARRESRSDQ